MLGRRLLCCAEDAGTHSFAPNGSWNVMRRLRAIGVLMALLLAVFAGESISWPVAVTLCPRWESDTPLAVLFAVLKLTSATFRRGL